MWRFPTRAIPSMHPGYLHAENGEETGRHFPTAILRKKVQYPLRENSSTSGSMLEPPGMPPQILTTSREERRGGNFVTMSEANQVHNGR